MQINDQTAAVISGGASGLGKAVAEQLARRKARVTIFDYDEEKGAQTSKEIGVDFIHCNVADSAAVAQSFARAREKNGQERICVNCAGVAPAAKTVSRGEAHDPGLFAKVIDINLLGTFHVASQSALGMSKLDLLEEEERGVIISTASVAAFDGQKGQIAYSASKGAVAAMMLPMARDLAGHAIRVMAVAPGIFQTPMLEAFPEELQKSLAEIIPHPKRLGTPEEFAKLVVHIVENSYLNGGTIRLDGAARLP
ncbi:MAG: SDR family NAD(P)-dependent oxidoreductase [Hyphomicrobiales bacterium]|nr:SDR family NAD(P)-dependent oxidoreductase [Hyphomicrobiales bacterium]MCY4033055.1 SDR family NAD(P)-dependent oxidoreductase [Hyphomicrobiales bacterium]